MSIVAPSQFIGQVAIAQTEQANVAAQVQAFINKYEPEYLRKVLGFTISEAFVAGLAANPIESKWLLLRSGSPYTDLYGNSQSYGGIVTGILDYVYYWYIRDQVTMTTGSGEKVSEKGLAVSSLDKQARAWNEAMTIARSCNAYLYANSAAYGYSAPVGNPFKPINTLGL